MEKNREEVVTALLYRLFGIPLSATQEALVEAWSDMSDYHREAVENCTNPIWVDEQLRIVRESPQDKIWERIQRGIRERRLAEDDPGLTELG